MVASIDKEIGMTDQEKALVKEALDLLDKGLSLLDSAQGNAKIHLLAKLVHSAISFGEMMI